MKLFGFELIDNRKGSLRVVDIEKRVRDVYIKGDNEDAYLAYRNITGVDKWESWRIVKPWIRKWEGKK